MAARPLSVSLPYDESQYFVASATIASPISSSDAYPDAPLSPSVLSAPFSVFPQRRSASLSHPGATSIMAASRSYRPQDWTTQASGHARPSFANASEPRRHTTYLDHSGMEASLPSPPPPYVSADLSASRLVPPISTPLSRPNAPRTDAQSRDQAGPSSIQDTRGSGNSTQALPQYNRTWQEMYHPIPTHIAPEYGEEIFAYNRSGPPASRRCHSTSELDARQQSDPVGSGLNASSMRALWLPGMTLPPPPPRGSPLTARSVSLGPGTDRLSPPDAAPGLYRRGRRVGLAEPTPLSPVPPTPADYIGDGEQQSSASSNNNSVLLNAPASGSQSRCLARRPAQKEDRPEAIRDRRSRSRALRDRVTVEHEPMIVRTGTIGDLARPANLVLTPPSIPAARKPNTRTDQLASLGTIVTRDDRICLAGSGGPTPPYSPNNGSRPSRISINSIMSQGSILSPPVSSQPTSSSRQIPTTVFTSSEVGSPSEASVIDIGLERLLDFHQRESAATTDQERLRLFAHFIVKESKWRREHYSPVFNAMAPELYNIIGCLWDFPNEAPALPRDEYIDAIGPESRARSLDAALDSTTPSETPMTPATDSDSLYEISNSDVGLVAQTQVDRFKPSLSPIPSMNVSTIADESDSRGRQPSRWWDGSSGEAQRGGIERSRQETKYMSLHPDIIHSPRSPLDAANPADEYPPEKVGWHEETTTDSPQTSQANVKSSRAQPSMLPLDVSRLVTLPPAYPRHYPAVNNCHPQLEPPRRKHREIADLEEIEKIRASFENEEARLQQVIDSTRTQRVNSFRAGVQHDIDRGVIDREIAIEADRRFRAHEHQIVADAARTAYERFQTNLFEPMNRMLDQKISEADVCINMMTLALTSTASSEHSSNASVQVGGDEEPELLEQLTLYKWLFEIRETLHNDVFDSSVLEKRKWRMSEKSGPEYRSLPRSQRDKDNAQFAAEIQGMHLVFATTANSRYQDLQSSIKRHVLNGVEAQLNAFWDICPRILEVVQRVPISSDEADSLLSHLPVIIPALDLAENPSMKQFPAQYLFTTLTHAQNSLRQFVDAQIDLLCLQHEIQTATCAAEARMVQAQRLAEGVAPAADVEGEMSRATRLGEEALLVELKGRVRDIEEGWSAALGDALMRARAAVRGYLERCGGWDDALES